MSISIWDDAWLPNNNHPYVQSTCPPNSRFTKVADLIVPNSSSWNESLITSLFGHTDRNMIRSIPLTDSRTGDKIIWTEDDKGIFTVKSCYKALMGSMSSTNTPIWTKFWNFKLPPKIKTFFWQLCSSSLPTHDRLKSRMVQVPDVCQICTYEEETPLH